MKMLDMLEDTGLILQQFSIKAVVRGFHVPTTSGAQRPLDVLIVFSISF